MSRLTELRGWFDAVIADPVRGAAQAKEMLETAGTLFDDGHLDGAQYHLVYELARLLMRPPGPDDPVPVARRCRDQI